LTGWKEMDQYMRENKIEGVRVSGGAEPVEEDHRRPEEAITEKQDETMVGARRQASAEDASSKAGTGKSKPAEKVPRRSLSAARPSPPAGQTPPCSPHGPCAETY
jgi:hypothetical protein